MSNAIISKYKNLVPINDEKTTDKLLAILVEVPPAAQQHLWVRDKNVGSFCVYRHSSVPGKVIEYVQGSADDSVTTLFNDGPIWSDLSNLKNARAELIEEIGIVTLALPSTVAVYDVGRERIVPTKELGTAQLIDALAHFAHTDLATA